MRGICFLRHVGVILLVMLLTSVGGCVRRTLSVNTDPPGALIYLNGVEAGRTPMERDFIYYGTYDVVCRKEGYETLKTRGKVIAPWWQWVPIDFFAEFLPLHDKQALTFTMYPLSSGAVDPEKMLNRAEELSTQLESSPHTRVPSTRPAATQPSTHK